MGGAAQAGNKLASIPTCCKPETKEDLFSCVDTLPAQRQKCREDLTKRLNFSRPEILEV